MCRMIPLNIYQQIGLMFIQGQIRYSPHHNTDTPVRQIENAYFFILSCGD